MNSTRSLLKVASSVKPIAQGRNMSALSGPPSYRMPFQEKLAHGLVMGIGWLAFPTWVLVNIKNYRGQASD